MIGFDCAKLAVGEGNSLFVDGITQFAESHEDACIIARQHRRDFYEMIATQELLPVTSEEYPEINGYYTLVAVDLRTDVPWEVHPLSFTLNRLGSANDLKFESRLVGTVKTNDFTVTENGSEPILAPPPHVNYDPRHTTTVARLVAYEDNLTVYRDISFAVDPKWSADPQDWYVAAASINRREPLYPQYGPISGLDAYFDNIEDIEISNGTVRFYYLPDGFRFGAWDGTAWREKTIVFAVDGVGMHTWNNVSIIQNEGQRCTLRYEGGITGRATLDVSLRRGDLGVSCLLTNDSSTTLGVYDNSLTDMTVTAGGSGTPPRMVYTSADANGHRLVFSTTRSFTSTAADAYMAKGTTTRFDAFIGMQLSSAVAGNQAASLALQYFAALSENIRGVRR